MLCLEPINKIFGIMKYLKHRENISMNNKHLCFHHLDLTNVDILTYLPPFIFIIWEMQYYIHYGISFLNPFTHSPPRGFPEVVMSSTNTLGHSYYIWMIQHSIELHIFKNFKGMLSCMSCLILFSWNIVPSR